MVRYLAAIAILAGCSSVELTAPVVRARTGPAAGRAIKRVVALPATCGALTTQPSTELGPGAQPVLVPAQCSPEAVRGADELVRSSLAFRGLQVIDSERVNAVTASRRETIVETPTSTSTSSETRGVRFEDAPPLEQAAILAELGADGVLNTRMWIGAEQSTGGRRNVVVQVRLLASADGALVWARRCVLEVGGLAATDAVALERAVRCATEGTR